MCICAMILVKLNDDNFEYDIYSLVKAFYPKEDITFVDGLILTLLAKIPVLAP